MKLLIEFKSFKWVKNEKKKYIEPNTYIDFYEKVNRINVNVCRPIKKLNNIVNKRVFRFVSFRRNETKAKTFSSFLQESYIRISLNAEFKGITLHI